MHPIFANFKNVKGFFFYYLCHIKFVVHFSARMNLEDNDFTGQKSSSNGSMETLKLHLTLLTLTMGSRGQNVDVYVFARGRKREVVSGEPKLSHTAEHFLEPQTGKAVGVKN